MHDPEILRGIAERRGRIEYEASLPGKLIIYASFILAVIYKLVYILNKENIARGFLQITALITILVIFAGLTLYFIELIDNT